MYPNIIKFNYHISYTHHNHNNAYTQLSHNSNATQCKTCDSMHVVPQCEPKVSPLSDSISRIQATLRSGQDQSHYAYFQLRINVYMDPTFHRFPIQYLESKPLRLFPIKDQRLLPCEPTVSPLPQ